jgi:hypothetical protein
VTFVIEEDDYLAHYGIIRRSGRYPWGSGGTAHGFMADWKKLRETMSEADAAEMIGMTTKEVRARKTVYTHEIKAEQVHLAQKYKDKPFQLSNKAIAERMGLAGESSVRALLQPGALDKANKHAGIVNMLREQMAEKTLLDVGEGVNLVQQLGVSREQLDAAITELEMNGEARLLTTDIKQPTGPWNTTFRVLCPHDYDKKRLFAERENIKQIYDTASEDHGASFDLWKDPLTVDPKRVQVVWGPEGGSKADGTIYIRPGVKDLSMGSNTFSQVRIKVGKDHFLKGMAVYKDDLPPGVDIQFNTNKDRMANPLDAMKPLKTDIPELPFGSIVRQILDKPGDPNAKVVSALNLVNEEADWEKWSKTISAQMLSKQNPKLIAEQLKVTKERRLAEFAEIMATDNPVVKKKLLEEFAEATDAASVHLKAAQLERSAWHVILPVNSLKENEIYAPNYKNGEKVALIRYPHGGPFEIPELTVNNNNRAARKIIGTKSAPVVGINHKVANHLSGADFDGDTVLVIPNGTRKNKIKTAPMLEGLKNFDPSRAYPGYPGMKVMSNTQMQMGTVSNLITDMTLKGATNDELTKAVRHSMVVIDAEKHKLNYKLSEQENGIKALRQKYQTGKQGAASTLISRKKTDVRRDMMKDRPHAQGGPIDLKTGERVLVPANKMKYDKDGVLVPRREKVPLLSTVKDAHEISSGSIQEALYADYSNDLKALANQARLESTRVPKGKTSPQAKKVYAEEVASLKQKVADYDRMKPRERDALATGQTIANERIRANPGMDDELKVKVRAQAHKVARARAGVSRIDIEFTDKEWEAIQAGAVSPDLLGKLLKRADMEKVKQQATPKTRVLMTDAKIARARQMLENEYTASEVASFLGVSMSTLKRGLGGE